MRRKRVVDRKAEHHPRDGDGRAQRNGDGLVRHAAEMDDAMAHALERGALRQRREPGPVTAERGVGRGHDHGTVEIEQHRDGRAHAARMVHERREDRRVVAARHGLLEAVVRHEHVDGGEQLIAAVFHVLVEQHARETDRLLRACVDVALDRVKNGKQREELARQDDRDGEYQNFVSEAELLHLEAGTPYARTGNRRRALTTKRC